MPVLVIAKEKDTFFILLQTPEIELEWTKREKKKLGK